jgi:hypothetical protein
MTGWLRVEANIEACRFLPRRQFMSQEDLSRVGTAIVLAVLVVTAPNWLSAKKHTTSGYDAPWVYPGLNPVVQAQMGEAHRSF